jgi:hypothetical protein
MLRSTLAYYFIKKFQFEVMRENRGIPGKTSKLELNSRDVQFNEVHETELNYQRITTQKVITEWDRGYIICRRWKFSSEDDIEIARV